jgi:sacsin
VFTENDFEAVIRIGVGSKRDEPSKIGRFGRGSLTMYRLSSISHATRCCGTNIQKVPLDVHSKLHLGGLLRHLRVRHPDLNTCGEELKIFGNKPGTKEVAIESCHWKTKERNADEDCGCSPHVP